MDNNQIELIKKMIIFSKSFYKIQKSFEVKNRSVSKQEEKIFIFSEIKNLVSYTKEKYWIQTTKDRINIILEKYNAFIEENNEEINNEIFIESFKSLISNQLKYLNKEMNYVSFSKNQIYDIFMIGKKFFESKNKEFCIILMVYLKKYLIETFLIIIEHNK